MAFVLNLVRKNKNNVDMTGRVWGHGLIAVRHVALGYVIFRCQDGHEFPRRGSEVRSMEKQGYKSCCPECVKLGKYPHWRKKKQADGGFTPPEEAGS